MLEPVAYPAPSRPVAVLMAMAVIRFVAVIVFRLGAVLTPLGARIMRVVVRVVAHQVLLG